MIIIFGNQSNTDLLHFLLCCLNLLLKAAFSIRICLEETLDFGGRRLFKLQSGQWVRVERSMRLSMGTNSYLRGANTHYIIYAFSIFVSPFVVQNSQHTSLSFCFRAVMETSSAVCANLSASISACRLITVLQAISYRLLYKLLFSGSITNMASKPKLLSMN